jgi:hypothetical protein
MMKRPTTTTTATTSTTTTTTTARAWLRAGGSVRGSILRGAAVVSLAGVIAGCATQQPTGDHRDPKADHTKHAIRHVVFIDLIDEADAPALLRAMDAQLAPIPSIEHYWRGTKLEADEGTARPTVRTDYDVALIVDFADQAGYDAYVADVRHKGLVEAWKPKLVGYVVYDIVPAPVAGR